MLKNQIFFIFLILCLIRSGPTDEENTKNGKPLSYYQNYQKVFGTSYEEDNSNYNEDNSTHKPISCTSSPSLCEITPYLNVYFPDSHINSIEYSFFSFREKPTKEKNAIDIIVNNNIIREYTPSTFPKFNPKVDFDTSISLGERERIKKSLILLKIILHSNNLENGLKQATQNNNSNSGEKPFPERLPLYKEIIHNFFNFTFPTDLSKYKEDILAFNQLYPSFSKQKDNPTFIADLLKLIQKVVETEDPQKSNKYYNELRDIKVFSDIYSKQEYIGLPDTNKDILNAVLEKENYGLKIVKQRQGAPIFYVDNNKTDENNITPVIFNYNGRLIDDLSSKHLIHIFLHAILHTLGYQHEPGGDRDPIVYLWTLLGRFLETTVTYPNIPYSCYSGKGTEWNNC